MRKPHNTALIHLFFQRLKYWQRRAVIRTDDGPAWICKSYDEWAVELQTSRSSAIRLINNCVDSKVIRTCVLPFQTRPTLHLRSVRLDSKECQFETPSRFNLKLFTYIQEDYRRLLMPKSLEPLSSNSKSKTKLPPSPEVLKEKDPRPAALNELWCNHYRDHFPEGMPPPILRTGKDHAQISRWYKEVESEMRVPEDVLVHAIALWAEFTRASQKKQGFNPKKAPTHPAWWFLYRNWRDLEVSTPGASEGLEDIGSPL